MTQIKHLEGATIDFPEEEKDTALLVEEAHQQASQGIEKYCGVRPVSEIVFYCFRTWRDPFLRHAPSQTRLMVILLFPFIYRQLVRQFEKANVWAAEEKSRTQIGVKPLRMFVEPTVFYSSWADRYAPSPSRGERLRQEVRTTTIAARLEELDLPSWLAGGINSLINNGFELPSTAPVDLPGLLTRFGPLGAVPDHFPEGTDIAYLSQDEKDKYAAPAVLCFWVTEFIERQRPGLIRSLIQKKCRSGQFTEEISAAFGISSQKFHREILKLAADHYRQFPPDECNAVENAEPYLGTVAHPRATAAQDAAHAGAKNLFRCTLQSKVRAGFSLFAVAAVAVGLELGVGLNKGWEVAVLISPLIALPMLVGMFFVRDFLRLLSVVEVDDESIRVVNWRGTRKTLRWHEISSVSSSKTDSRLVLSSVDRKTTLKLEGDFEDFSQLERIIRRRAGRAGSVR